MSYRLKLKEMRKASGLTQKEVAERANVKLSTYRTWEQGVSGISLEKAYALAIVLGCTLNDLCGWYEDHPREDSGERLTSEEREIVGCYRDSTPQWRKNISMTARAAAGESKEAAKRGVPDAEERTAM